MPHMVTVDKQNNVWLTDVALHQVFKFAPYGRGNEPLFVLGERFKPGSDDQHYCKPTSVAVSADGATFYVADGYCNSRIIKYSLVVEASGHHKVTKEWQIGEARGGISIQRSPLAFNVPHALTLAEDKNMICLADRENSRVQCFNAKEGGFVRSLKPQQLGRVYSVAYAAGHIYALNGPEPFGVVTGRRTEGLIISIDTGEVNNMFNYPEKITMMMSSLLSDYLQLEGTFNGQGQGFQNPHDVAVSADGAVLYEAELQPFRIFKLTNDGEGNPEPALNSSSSSSSSSSSFLQSIVDKFWSSWG
jgi:peptidylamidoglycolate lyase